jgi:hypothetical protein
MEDMWTGRGDDKVTVPGAEGLPDLTACEQSEGFGQCTRVDGHAGRHMASVGGNAIIAAWPGNHPPSVADLSDPEDIPEAAVEAVATNMMNRYESEYTLPNNVTWRDWEEPARADLVAAIPYLRDYFARH